MGKFPCTQVSKSFAKSFPKFTMMLLMTLMLNAALVSAVSIEYAGIWRSDGPRKREGPSFKVAGLPQFPPPLPVEDSSAGPPSPRHLNGTYIPADGYDKKRGTAEFHLPKLSVPADVCYKRFGDDHPDNVFVAVRKQELSVEFFCQRSEVRSIAKYYWDIQDAKTQSDGKWVETNPGPKLSLYENQHLDSNLMRLVQSFTGDLLHPIFKK